MDKQKIPIILVTGFLGAGKTSLINQILEQKKDLKISVILNEFGDVKLESQFIKSKKDDVIELTNGCMCCVAQYDFQHVINWILTEKPETQYVIVEASGLSDPMPIAQVLTEGNLKTKVTLETIVCVVDALNFFNTKEQYKTVMIQVSNSDLIVITKSQISETENINKITNFINLFLPRVTVLEQTKDFSVDLIFGQIYEHNDLSKSQTENHEHVDTLFWKSEKPLEFNKINSLLRKLPANIVRVKGILQISENNQSPRKFLIQYVGSRSEVEETEWLKKEQKQTAILLIGKDFDLQKTTQQLENCQIC